MLIDQITQIVHQAILRYSTLKGQHTGMNERQNRTEPDLLIDHISAVEEVILVYEEIHHVDYDFSAFQLC